MAACVTPRAPPTATTVFIYDAYTLRRTVVRALGHTAARKYDRYFAIAENPILINALLRKNAALDPDYATGFLLWAAAPSGGAVTQQMHVSEPSQPPVFVPAESKLSEPYLK